MTVQGPFDPARFPAPLGLEDDAPPSGEGRAQTAVHTAVRVGALVLLRRGDDEVASTGRDDVSGRDTVDNPLPWFLRALQPTACFLPNESGVYPKAAPVPAPSEPSRPDPEEAWLDDPREDWQSVVDAIADEEERRFGGHGTDRMEDAGFDDEVDAWAARCRRLECAARAADQHPGDAKALCDLAEARLELEAPRGAEADASRAIALAPRHEDGYLIRAKVRLALDDTRGALDDCERALSHQPRSVVALRHKARVHDVRREHDASIAALNLAITLQSRDHGLFKERARARALAGDLRGAREDATIAVAMAPSDGDALLLRGLLRKASGDAGASSDVQRALLSRVR